MWTYRFKCPSIWASLTVDFLFEFENAVLALIDKNQKDAITSARIDVWQPQNMNDLNKMHRAYGDKIRLGIFVNIPLRVAAQQWEEASLKLLGQ